MGAGFFNTAQITPELISDNVKQIEIVDMPKLNRYSAIARLARRSTLSGSAARFVEILTYQAREQRFLYSSR